MKFYNDYSNPVDRGLRFQAWKRYKELVDAEVKALEELCEKAFKANSRDFEDFRRWLNEMYHTQYELEKNMI